jgi:hypothetical protein
MLEAKEKKKEKMENRKSLKEIEKEKAKKRREKRNRHYRLTTKNAKGQPVFAHRIKDLLDQIKENVV